MRSAVSFVIAVGIRADHVGGCRQRKNKTSVVAQVPRLMPETRKLLCRLSGKSAAICRESGG
jgi:hypothetical protein